MKSFLLFPPDAAPHLKPYPMCAAATSDPFIAPLRVITLVALRLRLRTTRLYWCHRL